MIFSTLSDFIAKFLLGNILGKKFTHMLQIKKSTLKNLYLAILSIIIIFILLILGFSFPKGIYGIKPLKTITYIVNQQNFQMIDSKSSKPTLFFKIFLIILFVLTIIYFLLHPSRLISYILALLFLVFLFLFLPSILNNINFNESSKNLENKSLTENKSNDIDDNNEKNQIEIEPFEYGSKSKDNRLFYILLICFLFLFTFTIVMIFFYNLIKRIIKEIKEGKFSFFSFSKKEKKILINEVKESINTAIHLINTGNSIKDAIINCYIALLYSVKKYAKKSKDPGLTVREFEPILLSIGLEKEDISIICREFEKAKYSNSNIDFNTKEKVLKCLRNCILKLKK